MHFVQYNTLQYAVQNATYATPESVPSCAHTLHTLMSTYIENWEKFKKMPEKEMIAVNYILNDLKTDPCSIPNAITKLEL